MSWPKGRRFGATKNKSSCKKTAGRGLVQWLHSIPCRNWHIKILEMDGLEATKKIREFNPELPIIVTKAYAQTGDEHRILAAGCNEYLAKPIKSGDLMALIGKYAE